MAELLFKSEDFQDVDEEDAAFESSQCVSDVQKRRNKRARGRRTPADLVGVDSTEALDAPECSSRRTPSPVMIDGFVKPAYSYSCLIGLALKNSETGELTVAEIYSFLW